MAHDIQDIPLPFARPGTRRTIRVHRFGARGGAPKVYIQAGLHAGEIPGLLVADHLRRALARLDEEGAVLGEVVLVPVANPIGLDQVLSGTLMGRFELASGVNFNRAYPELSAAVADRVRGRLGSDAAANVALVRDALRQAVAEHEVGTQADAQRKLLMGLAVDADIVLDLHCDSEAVMHLYTMPELWDGFADLSARLGCRAALLEEDSGGEPFDETLSGVWRRVRARLGDGVALPMACAATTLELRGESDVDDTVAAGDAAAILDHLRVRGVLAGTPAPCPAPLCRGTPLAGVERIKAPAAGVVLYRARLGDQVAPGDLVAEILDPASGERHSCHATVAGPVWAASQQRFASAGDTILRIAGPTPLPRTGSLLSA